MLILGAISAISLPCIGYFDMHTYGFFHYVFAIAFFGTCFFYIWFVVGCMVDHRSEFPEDQQASIDRANRYRYIMGASAIFYAWVKFFSPYDTHSDFYEWVIVFMYLNALGIINLTNNFLDSIHVNVKST